MLRFLTPLLCLILGSAAHAGEAAHAGPWDRLATPYFNHIGRENGLPHDIVMDLAQDHDGFLWIATQGGLARWDGYRLRVFSHVEGDPGSLPDSTVMRLLVDEDGRLWAATISGLVARYDAANERFETLAMPGGGTGVPGGLVSDGTGGAWLGGTDGLVHVRATGWQKDLQIEGDASPAVRCLLRGHDGTLWACGTTRLYRRTPQAHALTVFETTPGDDPIRALIEDDKGRLWFGTEHSGIGLLDPATGKRTVLAPSDPNAGQIRELAQSGPDAVWGVVAGTGIIEADAATGAVTRLSSRDGPRGALGTDTLYAARRDRSGLIWVGGLGGVWYRAGGGALVDTIWPALDPQHGPWGLDVLGLCSGPDGRIWIGTLKAGLLTLDPKQGDQAAFAHAAPGTSADAPVIDCTVAPDGTAYAGQRKGFTRLSPGPLPAKAEAALPPAMAAAGAVRALTATRDSVWLGTEGGLFRADLHGEIRQHFEYKPEGDDGLTNNSIEVLTEDGKGNMWAGTHRGLNRIDEATGAVERIMPSQDPDSLPGLNVSTVLFDRRGRLWVGTIGGSGIGVLDHPEAGGPRHFRRIGTEEGLPSPNIGMLLEDSDGRIWASSTDGLYVIDPDTLRPRILGPADGVVIRSYWAHSGLKLADGTLLFGGLKGMSAVHPERLQDWHYIAPVRASTIQVGGHSLASGQPIQLKPKDRSLQVEFAALDYSAPAQNRYAYELQGYDADWVQTDALHRLAAYTNLPPGDYTLLLRGSNRLGIWTDPPTALPVHVLPAWHQTWWIHLLEGLGFLALIAIVVQLRTLSLARHRAVLEREVARRTVELESSQHELELSNITLAASAEMLRKLGEIGRTITASLDMDRIFAVLCRNIGAMLHADSVAIWLLDEPPTLLRLAYGIEDDQAMPPLIVPIDAPDRGVAQAARERREIMIDYPGGPFLPPIPGTKPMKTALFGPLIVNDELFGVLTVQSERPDAYGERERLVFTSLCAYGATALANAQAHRELTHANTELDRIASKDPLTGLANRHRFFIAAAEEVSRADRYRRSLSVIVADLDEFKRVNDTYGHAAGDTALQIAALCLAQCLRSTDLAARFGGEEFIVLMPETGIEGAAQVAERFREQLARTEIRHNDIGFPITVSIGVASWQPGETGIEAAIERADVALYRVKRSGRNAVAIESVDG